MCGDIESLPRPNHTFAEIQYLSKQRGSSMYHQNIRRLDAHYEGLCEILDSHRDIDFIFLSETDTTEEEEKQYAIDGYKHFIRSRKNGEGGGVAFCIKERIKWDRRYDLESKNIECLWVEMFIKKSQIFLMCSLYRPPNSSEYLSKDFETDFNDMIIKANTSSKEIIIMGDCNADYNKKDDCKEFKKVLLLNGFTQMIKSPTRVTKDSSTIIDIIASNNESNIKDTVTIPTSLSDHFMVGSLRRLNHRKFLPKEVKFRDYSKYNVDTLVQQLTAVDWSIIYGCKMLIIVLSY